MLVDGSSNSHLLLGCYLRVTVWGTQRVPPCELLAKGGPEITVKGREQKLPPQAALLSPLQAMSP